MITESCSARAALAGNPSDGYGGAVVSVPVPARSATVTVTAGDARPTVAWELVDATIRRHGRHTGHQLRTCAVDVTTTIPRSVGLAGSSAIVIALLRALRRHAGLAPLPPDELASLALSVEVDELGFAAGLQDRVVQAYDRPMLMRFGPAHTGEIAGLVTGTYDTLHRPTPGWLLVAVRHSESEPSQAVHRPLRERHEEGDPVIRAAMAELGSVAVAAAAAIDTGDTLRLGASMDRTFDIRNSIMDLRVGQVEMVEVARGAGAFANFAGSGGAVSVLAADEATSRSAAERLVSIGCEIIDVSSPASGQCQTPSVPSTP